MTDHSQGVNEPGFAHLSFETDDINAALAATIDAGGAPLGEVTDFGSDDSPFLIVYLRDPEGNILELEQPKKTETIMCSENCIHPS